MSEQLALQLPPSAPSDSIVINSRCTLRIEGEQRLVVVSGLPVHHYSQNDPVAEAYAMVFLVDSGFAKQREVARAFGRAELTVRRHRRRYADGGMPALATRSGWRPGRRRIPTKRQLVIERLNAQGLSNREIARRLGVTENAIRKQVGPATEPVQNVLSFQEINVASSTASKVSAPPAPDQDDQVSAASHEATDENASTARSFDRDASDRSIDRLLATLGLLDDAVPIFRDGTAVPGAGVMFAIPLLVNSGIFRLAKRLYGEIGPAFYGLRTTLLTMLLMALARIKRPEWLKERDPIVLGRILGLDRAPEVKTVRRKLTRLAGYHQAERLSAKLARLRVEQRGHLMGFLYVDGHVRAYHGKRKIPKTHVARMRLSMPATTDYWVNDQSGDPLFVVTVQANAGMVKMLPEVLEQARQLVGDRRFTIIFDRGGWSPKLFKQLIKGTKEKEYKDKVDIMTYRKGKCRRVSEQRFKLRRKKIDGRQVSYRLHDQAARFLKGTLRLRQVTRLCNDGHQTQVLTSRWDLRDIEVAHRMFDRWRQENFFKYMGEEFLIDALADYQVEPDDPTRTVPNPRRRPLDKQIRAARSEVAKLEQAYGAAATDNLEATRRTMRGFKIAHADLGKQLRAARQNLEKLRAKRRRLPVRVPVRDASAEAVIKLATERKHLTNIIKMVAYQTESDLVALLQPHFARTNDEGRTLLHELFAAAADIHVTDTRLDVQLAPLSSPHRTEAARRLCFTLNESQTMFPGTNLRLHFDVHPPPIRGLAFPGPRGSFAG
jgi:transposase